MTSWPWPETIFMNHAPGAITPLDPEMVQVGDAVGHRAEQRGLFQGAVRPVGVVEVLGTETPPH